MAGPQCATLLTTRFPQIALHFGPASRFVLQELQEEQGIRLISQLAPLIDPVLVAPVVRAVGGHPLALTLMGNYLRKQSYSGQPRRQEAALAQVRDRKARLYLSEPLPPGQAHPSLPANAHLSLQAVLAVADQHLDEQTRTALYALAVFPAKPHSFSEEAALAVTAGPVSALDALTDAGLLETCGRGRYRLHRIITDYARLHLTDTVAQHRLIAYAINYLQAHLHDKEGLASESSLLCAALEAAYHAGALPEARRLLADCPDALEALGRERAQAVKDWLATLPPAGSGES